MTIVRQTPGTLVLQEKPWLVWIVGGLFVISGLFLGLRSDETVFGSVFAIVGAGVILAFANTVTCTFDRHVNRFTCSSRGFVRSNDTTHPLAEIMGVRVEQSLDTESRTYRVALLLSSGARVPLTSSYSTGKADQERIAAAIRQFLNLQEGPDVPIPGFGDLFKILLNPDGATQRLSEMSGGAIAEYESIVRREPENIEARRQLATALAMQNRPAEARQHLEAARDLAVRHGNATLAAQFEVMLTRLHEAANRRA